MIRFGSLGEVVVAIFGQRSILESVCVGVILGQRVNLHFTELALHKVLERAMLLPRLALIPVFHLCVAHSRCNVLALNAVAHSLVECVAGMSRKTH